MKWIRIDTPHYEHYVDFEKIVRVDFHPDETGHAFATLYVSGNDKLISVGEVTEDEDIERLRAAMGLES